MSVEPMRQFHSSRRGDPPSSDAGVDTLPKMLARQASTLDASRIAIREKAYGIWQTLTWPEYESYVRRCALGLISLGQRPGEINGLIIDNGPEWLFGELGTHAAGGISLCLFTAAVAEELAGALKRVSARFVIVQDQEQVDKLLEVRERLPEIRHVIYVDPTGMRPYREDPWLISFADLISRGKRLERERPELYNALLKKGRATGTAVMILTSGTTGLPKIAMLSHGNLLAMGTKWRDALQIRPGENWYSMSPPAWIVDQMWGMGVALVSGMTMNFANTPETLLEDFREIGPHLLITSSRFWEDTASRIRVRMGDAGWLKRTLFAWAEGIGRKVLGAEERKTAPPFGLRLRKRIARRITFQPLLDRIGCSQLRSAFTGGHPISPDVIRFFRATGLNLKQCYGLTEAGGIFQVQPDGEVKPETVGKPLPDTQVMIGEDQEVMVKSDANFIGYYQDFAATEAAFREGWLRTGDAGYLDEDGHLVIIGRREEIIRNKEGQAFSPDYIETRLKFSPYIKEAVVFGEGKPFLTALVNIDFGNVGAWAEERMIPYTTYNDLSQQADVAALLREELRRTNERLPQAMRIRKFILLYKLLDADDEELTRTGKVRRRFVYGLYLPLIEAMYGDLTTLPVKGKVKYRDGQVGVIETCVRILEA
ncbi:MAG: AMP-binding protein [Syntrophales bacterium]|nr:AMP-binding protein [Syntrophales bacterium]MDD4339190.1 AMP-binding protein [Syntrophales bacterium]